RPCNRRRWCMRHGCGWWAAEIPNSRIARISSGPPRKPCATSFDRARHKRAQRHGGGLDRVDWEGFELAAGSADDQLLMVDEALEKLARVHPLQADLVKLRYFAGMTNEVVAEALGISSPPPRTIGFFHAPGSSTRSKE